VHSTESSHGILPFPGWRDNVEEWLQRDARGVIAQRIFFEALEADDIHHDDELIDAINTELKSHQLTPLSTYEAGIVKKLSQEFQRREQLVKAIYHSLVREATQGAIDSSEPSLIELGKLLFKRMTQREPQGEVTLQRHRLALGLVASHSADLSALRLDPQSGGHFNWAQPVSMPKFFSQVPQPVPFILVKEIPIDTEKKRVVAHESNHATHDVVVEALHETGNYDWIWGGNSPKRLSNRTELNKAVLQAKERGLETKAEWTAVFDELLPDALAEAKNELLADFNRAGGDFHYLQNLLWIEEGEPDLTVFQDIKKKGAINLMYHYLKVVDIHPGYLGNSDPDLYRDLAQKYNQELTRNVRFISELWDSMYLLLYELGLVETYRQEIVQTLTQYPLERWEEITRVKWGSLYRRVKKIADLERTDAYTTNYFSELPLLSTNIKQQLFETPIAEWKHTIPSISEYTQRAAAVEVVEKIKDLTSEFGDQSAPAVAVVSYKLGKLTRYWDLTLRDRSQWRQLEEDYDLLRGEYLDKLQLLRGAYLTRTDDGYDFGKVTALTEEKLSQLTQQAKVIHTQTEEKLQPFVEGIEKIVNMAVVEHELMQLIAARQAPLLQKLLPPLALKAQTVYEALENEFGSEFTHERDNSEEILLRLDAIWKNNFDGQEQDQTVKILEELKNAHH